ncbi:hypothetical protein FA13DRAFT_1709657 [Coprinellus micaceus]|uniref:DNA 3'-5' helicase n=1 Tax=Coprinellus micaceus TaxID=71717 RepID=A0A4Y7TC56_COPMI|nr:hypothetical protein FA13DRAFT_1709657 [Coprinellus micaceus]
MKRARSNQSADVSQKKSKPEIQTCEICEKPLSAGLEKTHIKCARNTVSLAGIDGAEYSFYRQSDRTFHCTSCEFKHSDRPHFVAHVTSTHLNAQPEHPPSPVGQVSTPQESRSDTPEMGESEECKAFLERHGLTVCGRLLVCIECKSVVDYTKVRKHFLSQHKELDTATNVQTVFNSAVLTAHPTLVAEPKHPEVPIERIPYLETRYAFMRCLSCNRCYQGPETYNQHNCLPGGKRGDTVMYDCQRPWFPIKKALSTPFDMRQATPYQIYLNSQRNLGDEAIDGSQIDEVRIRHQFLEKEGWIKHIHDTKLSRKVLMDFAKVTPRDPLLMKLGALIYSFLRRVQNSTPHNTLRRMIGIRPASEHEVSVQRHHFNVSDPTLKKYSRTMVGVLQLVRRSNDGEYPFQVHASISKLTDSLFAKLAGTVSDSTSANFELDDSSVLEGLVLDEDGEPVEDYSSPSDNDELLEDSGISPIEENLIKLLRLIYTTIPKTASEVTMHSPVMQYLLLSSVHPDGAWASTTSITQKIAGATFIGRVTFAHLITHLSKSQNITAHEAFDTFKDYLLERSDGIMPNLYLLHRGLASISSAEQSGTLLSSPSWDSNAVTIGEKNLHFHEIGSMIRRLEGDIERDLAKVLFDSETHLAPLDEQIYDEPRRTVPGYSFIDDQRNSWTRKPSMIEHVLQTPELLRRFGTVSPDRSRIDWHTGAITDWLREAFELQEKFMIAIVLSYGEPARSTELVTTLLRNYPGGSIRNIYHTWGTLFLRGSYNKTSFFTGKDKVMARAPLPAISRHFVRFLAFVRPLFSEWQRVVRPKMYHNSFYYLFCGLSRPITSVDLSKALTRSTLRDLGVPISPSLHRQIMAFITSRYRRAFPTGSMSTGTDEQLGHSQKMDRKHYGLDANIPGQLDHESLQTCLEISAIFHRLLSMDTELLKSIAAQQINVQDLIEELEAIRCPARASGTSGESNAHSATVPDPRTIANGVSQYLAPFLTQQIKEKVEHANASIVHLFAPDRISAESTHILPSTIVNVHPSLIRRLRQMIPGKPNIGFTSLHQAQATQLAIERERSFLLITPTGSGKTLPALLASKFYDGERTTVWILPLRSMRAQLRKSCVSQGLEVTTYDFGLAPENAPRNLLVAIEKTEKQEFQDFLQSLCAVDKLARIVLDEAHLVLTHKSFRPVMDTLRWLGQKSIQTILLTATLPVHLVNRLFDEISLSAPLVLRTTTERANVSINVTVVDSDASVEEEVISTYNRTRASHPDGQALIFSRSRRSAEEYGRRLRIPHVHAEMEIEEIEAVLSDFRSGAVPALSCTSFLGVGLDIPNVTHVIHAGLPYDLLSYSQEAGRAGRERNSLAWSHIIANRNSLAHQDDDEFGSRAMKEFVLDDSTCRRILPWTYLDGAALPCSMLSPTPHLCDVCEKDSHNILTESPEKPIVVLKALPKAPAPPVIPPLTSSSRSTLTIASRVSQIQTKGLPTLTHSILYRRVARFGKHFANHCAQCHLDGKNKGHLFSTCQYINQTEYQTWLRDIRRRLPRNTCFCCGLPKGIQYSKPDTTRVYLHEWTVDGQTECEYSTAFLAFVYLSHRDPLLRSIFTKPTYGFRPEEDTESWIVADPPPTDSDGTPPSNFILLLDHLSSANAVDSFARQTTTVSLASPPPSMFPSTTLPPADRQSKRLLRREDTPGPAIPPPVDTTPSPPPALPLRMNHMSSSNPQSVVVPETPSSPRLLPSGSVGMTTSSSSGSRSTFPGIAARQSSPLITSTTATSLTFPSLVPETPCPVTGRTKRARDDDQLTKSNKIPRTAPHVDDFRIHDGVPLAYIFHLCEAMREGQVCGGCFGAGFECNHHNNVCDRNLANGLSDYKTFREEHMNGTRNWCFNCGLYMHTRLTHDMGSATIHPWKGGKNCSYSDGPLCAVYTAFGNPCFQKVLVANKGNEFSDFKTYTAWVKGKDGNTWNANQVNPTMWILNELGILYAREHLDAPHIPSHPIALTLPPLPSPPSDDTGEPDESAPLTDTAPDLEYLEDAPITAPTSSIYGEHPEEFVNTLHDALSKVAGDETLLGDASAPDDDLFSPSR